MPENGGLALPAASDCSRFVFQVRRLAPTPARRWPGWV